MGVHQRGVNSVLPNLGSRCIERHYTRLRPSVPFSGEVDASLLLETSTNVLGYFRHDREVFVHTRHSLSSSTNQEPERTLKLLSRLDCELSGELATRPAKVPPKRLPSVAANEFDCDFAKCVPDAFNHLTGRKEPLTKAGLGRHSREMEPPHSGWHWQVLTRAESQSRQQMILGSDPRRLIASNTKERATQRVDLDAEDSGETLKRLVERAAVQ